MRVLTNFVLQAVFLGLLGQAIGAAGTIQGLTRQDLLCAYQRFDEAWNSAEHGTAAFAEACLVLDQGMALFARGDTARGIANIDNARALLLSSDRGRLAARVLCPLRLELDPPGGVVGARQPLTARLTRLYPVHDAETGEVGRVIQFAICLIDAEGRMLRSVPVDYQPDTPPTWRINLVDEFRVSEPARYRVEMRDSAGVVYGRKWWPVLRQGRVVSAFALSGMTEIQRKISAYSGPNRGWEAFLNRVSLLNPATDDESASRVVDAVALEEELHHEFDELVGGGDPYFDRAGATWRVARIDGVDVPYWVVAPPFDPKMPAPSAVMALHDAGLDESQWMVAYGQGELARLARERRFLLILPRTECLLGASEWLKGLLLDVGREYYFDRARVFMIGHGDGAAAAAGAANRDPELVAGLALLGGGENLIPSDRLPPVLYALGGLDQIAPNGQIRIAAERAHAAGARIDVLELKGHGHMTLVPQSLKAALALLGV